MLGGAPWEVPQNYIKNSALFHCKGATTPTLFLMGNPDLNGADRDKTVFMLHNALKGQGVETEYVQYLDEGHMDIFKKEKKLIILLMKLVKNLQVQKLVFLFLVKSEVDQFL
jgi:dipeptidyl aminopeptidase/acylaminoacyl peptidase